MQNRDNLIAFVKEQHGAQLRKYTNAPYFTHLEAVANAAEKTGVKYGWEIGICHDILEDTNINLHGLVIGLHNCGYADEAISFIVTHVEDLTDHFTSDRYPYLNRALRKQCEALRLHAIDRTSQIVKCCDLIDNTSSILQYDLGFARKYIPEKRQILIGFTKIDGTIKSQVWNCLLDAEQKLLKTTINTEQ